MNAFIRKSTWGFADLVAALFCLLFVIWLMSPLVFPANAWMILNKVEVLDAKAGEEIQLSISREKKQGTQYGRYEVDVREYPSQSHVCSGYRSVDYADGTSIEENKPRALDWWAWSEDKECVDWVSVPGQYFITTRHCWYGAWWAREACNPATRSNVFKVTK